jgi:hypothetical protein
MSMKKKQREQLRRDLSMVQNSDDQKKMSEDISTTNDCFDDLVKDKSGFSKHATKKTAHIYQSSEYSAEEIGKLRSRMHEVDEDIWPQDRTALVRELENALFQLHDFRQRLSLCQQDLILAKESINKEFKHEKNKIKAQYESELAKLRFDLEKAQREKGELWDWCEQRLKAKGGIYLKFPSISNIRKKIGRKLKLNLTRAQKEGQEKKNKDGDNE